MLCASCGHVGDDGRFCINCGAELQVSSESASTQEITPNLTSEQADQPNEPNVYVEKAKNISFMYGHYVTKLIKKPVLFSEQIDRNNFVNGLISQIIFVLAIPFIMYIAIKSITFGIFSSRIFDPSFFTVVVKSIVFLAVLLAIISLAIFGYIKLCKSTASIRDVAARFGAFLTIPAAIQLVALLTAVVQLTSIAIMLVSFGLFGLLVAISLTIYSYRKDLQQGIDAFYGILLTFLIMAMFFRVAGGEIISSLYYALISVTPLGF